MTNSPLSADAQAIMTFEANQKSAGVAYLLWFLAGGFGGHRFYIGRTGSAVTQLLLSFFGWTTIWFLGFGLLFLIPLGIWSVSYTHLRAPRDQRGSRMPSSA